MADHFPKERTVTGYLRLILSIAFGLSISACDSPPSEPSAPPQPAVKTAVTLDTDTQDALTQQRELWQADINALLEDPSPETLAAADQQWQTLYTTFNQHYLSLAITACANDQIAVLRRLDSWPFYPAYVDALPTWPNSGIVNDPALDLTSANLRQQQGATTDGEVALGFQPIRLLIAGVEDTPRNASELHATSDQEASKPQARRRTYLRLASQQLDTDLKTLNVDVAPTHASLYCALQVTGKRLNHVDTHRQAVAPEDGLYISQTSIEIIDTTLLEATLVQLADDTNEQVRRRLETERPGFQAALSQARDSKTWAPLQEWLRRHAD